MTDDGDQRDDERVSRLRDEVVKRMLATPPQPRTAKDKAPKASRANADGGEPSPAASQAAKRSGC